MKKMFKNALLMIALFFTLLFSGFAQAGEVGNSKDNQIQTTFNVGAGVTKADEVKAVASVGVEVIGEYSWLATDLSYTAGKDASYAFDTKLGVKLDKIRPYTSFGYVRSSIEDFATVGYKKEDFTYGVGVRYDVTQSVFLDFSYKKATQDNLTAKVHYRFN